MLSSAHIDRLLTLQTDKLYLKARESRTLEFKRQFQRAGLVEMAKDLAAFANNEGGYLIYGVKDSPREPIGMSNDQFDSLDDAEITQAVNQYFAPSIKWERVTYEWNDKRFGVMYVHPGADRPIIAIQNGGRNQEIRAGEIYYRYGAQTTRISYAELRALIDEKVTREREAWFRLLERIGRIGPENAAVLDTVEGRIESGNRTIVIDDALIPRLKFIREGQFQEEEGALTLRLVGDLHPASIIHAGREVVHDDPYRFRAMDVAEQVEEAIGKTFRVQPEHIRAWKHYAVRRTLGEGRGGCNRRYCDCKEALNTFMYTREWIDLLIAELSDTDKYNRVVSGSE
ncbi:ATP-binding protein [Chloroflexota bacterium]